MASFRREGGREAVSSLLHPSGSPRQDARPAPDTPGSEVSAAVREPPGPRPSPRHLQTRSPVRISRPPEPGPSLSTPGLSSRRVCPGPPSEPGATCGRARHVPQLVSERPVRSFLRLQQSSLASRKSFSCQIVKRFPESQRKPPPKVFQSVCVLGSWGAQSVKGKRLCPAAEFPRGAPWRVFRKVSKPHCPSRLHGFPVFSRPEKQSPPDKGGLLIRGCFQPRGSSRRRPLQGGACAPEGRVPRSARDFHGDTRFPPGGAEHCASPWARGTRTSLNICKRLVGRVLMFPFYR